MREFATCFLDSQTHLAGRAESAKNATYEVIHNRFQGAFAEVDDKTASRHEKVTDPMYELPK